MITSSAPTNNVSPRPYSCDLQVLRRHCKSLPTMVLHPIHIAARDGKEKELDRLLHAEPHLMELRTDERMSLTYAHEVDQGCTCLIIASAQNHVSMVSWLLGQGADVHAQDRLGRTAFFYACKFIGSVAILRLLINAGADPNHPETDGAGGVTPLVEAIRRENVEIIQWLLNLKTINLEQGARRSLVSTPLWLALSYGSSDMVRSLLQAGADPRSHFYHLPTAPAAGSPFELLKVSQILKGRRTVG